MSFGPFGPIVSPIAGFSVGPRSYTRKQVRVLAQKAGLIPEFGQNGNTLSFNSKDNTFLFKHHYYYSMGKTSEHYVAKIRSIFPNAQIVADGSMGYNTRNSSMYVRFRVPLVGLSE